VQGRTLRSDQLRRAALRAVHVLRGAANLLEGAVARYDFRRAPADAPGAFKFASSYQLGDVQVNPFQVESEILDLMALLAERRPARIVEIGTAKGGTLFLLTRVASNDATIVTVDLPGGPFGGGYRRTHSNLMRSFAHDQQRIHLVRGDSHATATVDKVRAILGGSADCLFIDGDHTYEGVQADFEKYSPLVSADGLIAFHDIVPGPPEYVGNVPDFWQEVKTRFEHREIVADWDQGGYGIGVLYRGRPLA
jgi:predicted O-methyltransferase YrrM